MRTHHTGTATQTATTTTTPALLMTGVTGSPRINRETLDPDTAIDRARAFVDESPRGIGSWAVVRVDGATVFSDSSDTGNAGPAVIAVPR